MHFCSYHKNCFPFNKYTEHFIMIKRPHSVYHDSKVSGQTPIFGVVFFVSKSLSGIEKQSLKKITILTRKPQSHVRILIYQTWPITRRFMLQTKKATKKQFVMFVFSCTADQFLNGYVLCSQETLSRFSTPSFLTGKMVSNYSVCQ